MEHEKCGQILRNNTNLKLGCVGHPAHELVGVGVI